MGWVAVIERLGWLEVENAEQQHIKCKCLKVCLSTMQFRQLVVAEKNKIVYVPGIQPNNEGYAVHYLDANINNSTSSASPHKVPWHE